MVGPGKAIDTNKWHVVCPSVLGAPFGTSSAASINPEYDAETKQAPEQWAMEETGESVECGKQVDKTLERQYGKDFPQVTVEDLANCHARLLDLLGLDRIYCVLGCSFGGMQTLQLYEIHCD